MKPINNSNSSCPLVRTALLIGDEWILLVLRELFKKPHKFDELQKATTAATNILTNRLQRMVEAGIVEKILYQERPPRYSYRLSKAGLALFPVALAMMRYGEDWLPNGQESPWKLRHTGCGEFTRPGAICTHCGELVRVSTLRLETNEDGTEQIQAPAQAEKSAPPSRTRKTKTTTSI
jgi:DNA-binding HxlR family transcriptional regulator